MSTATRPRSLLPTSRSRRPWPGWSPPPIARSSICQMTCCAFSTATSTAQPVAAPSDVAVSASPGPACPAPRLPRVEEAELTPPTRLRMSRFSGYAPAYWVLARRSWPVSGGRTALAGIKDTTYVFNRFKTGTEELAYPLARGIADVLKERDLDKADFIVPIPLSPDKAKAGELHRTLALANELSQLLGINVRQAQIGRASCRERV